MLRHVLVVGVAVVGLERGERRAAERGGGAVGVDLGERVAVRFI